MSQIKRTFIALKITPEKPLLDCVANINGMLNNSVLRWEPLENYHLTLHFIGSTSLQNLSVIKEIIWKQSTFFKPFEIAVEGVGFFYRDNVPAVVWAGINPPKELSSLYNKLQTELLAKNIEVPLRIFKPHLTLGRFKKYGAADDIISIEEKYKKITFQKSSIKEIFFYESILKPNGAVFVPLYVVALE